MGRDSREKGGEIGASPTDPRPGFVSVYDVPRGRARPGSRGNWLPASRALGEGAGARSASDRPPRFLGYWFNLVVLCGVGKSGNQIVFWALAPEFRCFGGKPAAFYVVSMKPMIYVATAPATPFVRLRGWMIPLQVSSHNRTPEMLTRFEISEILSEADLVRLLGLKNARVVRRLGNGRGKNRTFRYHLEDLKRIVVDLAQQSLNEDSE